LWEIMPDTGLALDSTRNAYTVVAVLICGSSLLLIARIVKILFFGELKSFRHVIFKKPILFAWFLLLLPNIVVMLVYFCEHMQILVTQKQAQDGHWCRFVAFTAIISMVCLNGSCLTIAITMYQIVKMGTKYVWRTVIYGNLLSWLCGICIGIWYIAGNSLGPYRGLYCCIRGERYNGPRIFLIYGSFIFSICAQSFLYISAFRHIRDTELKAQSNFTAQSIHSVSGPEDSERVSGGGTMKITPTASRIFMKKGIMLVSIYYVCWFWISVDALIAFSGKTPSLASSIVGAIFAKMNSVIHCMVMTSHINKARNTVGATLRKS